MSLEKLVKEEFYNRLGIQPEKKAVETFAARFFAKHQIKELLRDATDADFIDALKAMVNSRAEAITRQVEQNDTSDTPIPEKAKGGRK